MNPELKSKWIEALRSGKYNQGRGRLANEELTQFCCLGVLCDIQGMDWSRSFVRGIDFFAGSLGFPPEGYRDNLASSDLQRLTQLNDSSKMTFNDIADWIEEHL